MATQERTDAPEGEVQQTPAVTNPSLQDGAVPGPELISRRAQEVLEERERAAAEGDPAPRPREPGERDEKVRR